jgi:hypothetical protein
MYSVLTETFLMRTFLKNSNALLVKVIFKHVTLKPFGEYGRRALRAVATECLSNTAGGSHFGDGHFSCL